MRHGEGSSPGARFGPWLAGLLCALAGVVAAAELDVELAPAGDGDVRFSVTNAGAAPVALLLRDTPLDRFVAHDAFEVLAPARNWPGVSRLAWIGPVAKRLPPGADEVRALAPGETVSSIVPVDELYAVPEGGDYTVRWAGELRVATGAGDAFAGVRPAPASARLALEARPASLGTRVRPADYANCSADERAIIDEAALVAETWSVESRTGLEALSAEQRPASPRYRLWFGQYDAERFDVVLDAFRAIEGALTDRSLSYDCGCDEPGVFAYVNPFIAYDITLCPVFWATTADGRDSRAGTIVHELSHFRTVASTVDHAYAQVPSQRLAQTRPDLAIENADSYGYFAENRPAVAIAPDGASRGDDAGGAGAGFAALAPGEAVEGELARGARARYRIDGGTSVALESLSGDADLAVFADAALTRRTCLSETVEPVDACALPDGGTAWVEVRGYTAARYRLAAGPAVDPEVAAGEGIPVLGALGVGDAVTGEVDRGDIVAWRLTDAGVVELRSEAGDADLYVHSVPRQGQPLSEATLVCRSFGDSAQGDVVERCLVGPGAPHYALVAGFETAAYTLSVGAAAEATARPVSAVGDGSAPSPGGVPVDDPAFGSGSGGGGAPGSAWLTLLAPVALRLRRRAQSRAMATP